MGGSGRVALEVAALGEGKRAKFIKLIKRKYKNIKLLEKEGPVGARAGGGAPGAGDEGLTQGHLRLVLLLLFRVL